MNIARRRFAALMGLAAWRLWAFVASSLTLADLDLVLAIAGKAADKPGKAAREAYRQAVQRGASVRECSSITEHLTFLLALIPDGDPIVGLIDQIKEDLA